MSPRVEAFNRLKKCPIRKNLFRGLENEDVIWCQKFIDTNDHLSYGDFNFKVNRLGLDGVFPEGLTPINLRYVWAVLTEVNGILFKRRRSS